MKECQFMIIIERQPEGEYLVSPPALPGCYTEGSTLEEARCPSVTKPGTSGLVTV